MTQRQRCARCRGPVTGNGSVENNTDRFRSNAVNASVHVTILSTKEKLVFDCCYLKRQIDISIRGIYSGGISENLSLDLLRLYLRLNISLFAAILKKF